MATGVAHKFNAMKFKILMSVLRNPNLYVTTREIADDIDAPITNVSKIINTWHNRNYGYLSRLPKFHQNQGYKYKILKHGVRSVIQYKRRMSLGFDLNCTTKHIYPQKVDCYTRITRRGEEMGLTEEDLPDFSEYID